MSDSCCSKSCSSGGCSSEDLDEKQGFTKEIAKGAKLWFFLAGGFSICLSIFLFQVNQRLAHSKREEILNKTLVELRTAQTSLTTGGTDIRTDGEPAAKE